MASDEPLVVQIIRRQKELLIARDDTQMRRMGQEWVKFERELQGRIESLAEEVYQAREKGLTPDPDRIAELTRYKALLRDVHRELREYSAWVEDQITHEQRERIWQGTEDANEAIRAAGSPYTIGLDLNRLPVQAVENMVGLAGDGSPLMELLRKSWADSADGLMNALIDAIKRGTNPRQTALEMLKGVAAGPAQMLNIARTEQMRVYREASRMGYRRSGLVTGYRRLATNNERTCLGCLALDGTLYKLSEPLSDHPSGRCTLVPIVDGAPPLDWLRGYEWLAQQGEDVQRRIMGAERFALWRESEVTLSLLGKVVPDKTWGGSVRPLTVEEMRELVSKRGRGRPTV